MPISYTIDSDAAVIEEVFAGDISASELAGFWKRMLSDPQALAVRRSLADLRQCTITLSGAELSVLIETIAVPMLQGRSWTSAMLVAHPVQYGVSRQYLVYAERFANNAIFHDRDAALVWLEVQRQESHDA